MVLMQNDLDELIDLPLYAKLGELHRRAGAGKTPPAEAASAARSAPTTRRRSRGVADVSSLRGLDLPPVHREKQTQIDDRLVQDFEPATAVERLTIEHLASDYAEISRVREALQAAYQPQALPKHDQERWDALRENRVLERIVHQAVGRLSYGLRLDLAAADAKRLAESVLATADGFTELFEEICWDQEEAEAEGYDGELLEEEDDEVRAEAQFYRDAGP